MLKSFIQIEQIFRLLLKISVYEGRWLSLHKNLFKSSPQGSLLKLWVFRDLRFQYFQCHDVFIVRGLGSRNKNFFFLNFGQIRIILSKIAYAQCTLATIFDFELSQKKLFQIRLRSTWMCQNNFFVIFNSFHWLKIDLVKGTQDWEFFWLRFWILYYFIVSYFVWAHGMARLAFPQLREGLASPAQSRGPSPCW